METLRRFSQLVESSFERYFSAPASRSFFFLISTILFLFALGNGLAVLLRYWNAIPSDMHVTVVLAVLCTPFLWIRALQEHRTLRRMIESEKDPSSVRRTILKEVASSSLFILTFAYWVIALNMTIIRHVLAAR